MSNIRSLFEKQLQRAKVVDEELMNQMIENRKAAGWTEDRLAEFKASVPLGSKQLFYICDSEAKMEILSFFDFQLDKIERQHIISPKNGSGGGDLPRLMKLPEGVLKV